MKASNKNLERIIQVGNGFVGGSGSSELQTINPNGSKLHALGGSTSHNFNRSSLSRSSDSGAFETTNRKILNKAYQSNANPNKVGSNLAVDNYKNRVSA